MRVNNDKRKKTKVSRWKTEAAVIPNLFQDFTINPAYFIPVDPDSYQEELSFFVRRNVAAVKTKSAL